MIVAHCQGYNGNVVDSVEMTETELDGVNVYAWLATISMVVSAVLALLVVSSGILGGWKFISITRKVEEVTGEFYKKADTSTTTQLAKEINSNEEEVIKLIEDMEKRLDVLEEKSSSSKSSNSS